MSTSNLGGNNAPGAPTTLFETDAALRAEAGDILEKQGLRGILAGFGHAEITGSYVLELMTWRDLDTYVINDALTVEEFFTLGARVAECLGPERMHFRNERIGKMPGLPNGLYWGVYLGQGTGAWKIDIWGVGAEEGSRLIGYCAALSQRLTRETRDSILNIKTACCHHPAYRKSFYSTDIYTAVLDHGVRDLAKFEAWLESKRGIRIGG